MSVLAAAVTLAELCRAPDERAAGRDPADAAVYIDVGDAAVAAGDPITAVIAYRKARARDPDDRRAAAAIATLCAAGDGDGADDDADAGDGALLAAIARYRAGDHAAARAALAAVPGSSTAHLFLALIALEQHDGAAAIRELAIARGDPRYRELAEPLLRLAHRDGRLALAVVVEPELDTNPQLLPDTPPAGAVTGARQADEDVVTAATVTARPWPWLALRNALSWRAQRALPGLDFFGESAQAAAELAGARDRLTARYDFDADLLDGASYLFAHRLAAAYRHDFAGLAVVASYGLRRRDYVPIAEQAFTGWVHAFDAGVVVALPRGLELEARLIGGRELTRDPTFANLGGGGAVTVRTRPLAAARVVATARALYAGYDAAQPDGVVRRDLALDGAAELEIDLGDHLTALAGADLTRNLSTIEDFRFWKLVMRAGLLVAFGGL